MAKIRGFMFCDKVATTMVSGNLVPCVFQPLTSISIPGLPAEKSFSLSFCISDIDSSTDHEIQIVITHNDKTIIDMGTNKLEKDRLQDEIILNADVRNLSIQETGELYTKIMFDNAVLGEYPINVHLTGDSK